MLRKCFNIMPIELLKLINKKGSLLLIQKDIDFFNKNTLQNINLLEPSIYNNDAYKFKDIVGSSSNAIIALLLGLRYKTEEITNKINDLTQKVFLNNIQDNKQSVITNDRLSSAEMYPP